MDTTKTTDEINQERRRFFGTAAMSIAATMSTSDSANRLTLIS